VIEINTTVSSYMPVAQTSSKPVRRTVKAKWLKVSEILVAVVDKNIHDLHCNFCSSSLHLILFCNGYLYSFGSETCLITDYSKVPSSRFISSDQMLGLYVQFLTYTGSVL
jgi:hypothetical protein